MSEDDRGRAASSALPPPPSEQSTRLGTSPVPWFEARHPWRPAGLGVAAERPWLLREPGGPVRPLRPIGPFLGNRPCIIAGAAPGSFGRGSVWLKTAVAGTLGRRCPYGLGRYRSSACIETAIRGEGGAVRLPVVPMQDVAPLGRVEAIRPEFSCWVSTETREPPAAIDGSVTTLLESASDLDLAAVPVRAGGGRRSRGTVGRPRTAGAHRSSCRWGSRDDAGLRGRSPRGAVRTRPGSPVIRTGCTRVRGHCPAGGARASRGASGESACC